MSCSSIQKLRLNAGPCWVHSEVAGHLGLTDSRETIAAILKATPLHTFKDDRRSRVTRVRAAGKMWVVKRYMTSPIKNVLYHWAGLTPAWRELDGGGRLHSAGLHVALPLALIHHLTGQTLVLPYIDGETLNARLESRGGSTPADHRMAEAIGRQIGRTAAAGLINRDYKPTNLIIPSDAVPDNEPVIIDPAGIRRFKSASQIDEMLSVLVRAAVRVGFVRRSEMLACCRGVLETCPSIAESTHALLRRVADVTNARPLSYDPVTGRPLKA